MYQKCSVCIMDNANDETIVFDAKGQCNYCKTALKLSLNIYFPGDKGKKQLSLMIDEIKTAGKSKKYDCIMGISGGLDSSYLAYLGKKWGLRVLAIHVDDGFDTEVSRNNINKLIEACGFDMHVIKPDKEQYYSLTKAYMKAGVANIAVPQDNILFAELYKCLKKFKIKYFLAGGNFALESILSVQNTHSAYDVVNIKDISRRFNNRPIDKLKFISSFERIIDKKIYKLKTILPLNYVNYNRELAFKELKEFCGFEYYGAKHLENKLTAFVQLYWFVNKFGEDKRLAHYSSMIVSNQLTRNEALNLLKEPLYDKELMDKYINEIKIKLEISDLEFDLMMNNPVHKHIDYKTEDKTLLYKLVNLIKGKRVKS